MCSESAVINAHSSVRDKSGVLLFFFLHLRIKGGANFKPMTPVHKKGILAALGLEEHV
jgi:hypothetical protein